MNADPQTIPQKPVFKSSSWYLSRQSNKKRAWKGLKQIISSEKSLPWAENVVHYSSINAPPSFKPPEKFSDLSGLLAPYTDPQSRLRYANKEEYATIIDLPMDITAGYLALRGATSIVG
ncbi:INO80 complex subunit C [Anthonomus grandis grandis]|uniref:INO80 complex subunit C n=1 Tax=Anthonomus grandis grandis TaxID=2921223 RepID=UPI002165198A|nr:INO80 complex subunit C [Anthonomus grandis grandis]